MSYGKWKESLPCKMVKSYSYRELVKVLRAHDNRFQVHKNRGKGSERMLYHPDIGGRPASYPLKCHSESDPIRPGHIPAIRRRFKLPGDVLK